GFHTLGVSEQAIAIIAGPYADLGIRNAKLERMLDSTVPVGKTNGEPGFCAADLEHEEVWSAGVVRIVVQALKNMRVLLCFLMLTLLRAVSPPRGGVVRLVQSLLLRSVLLLLVGAVGRHGIEESLPSALVLADSVKNLSGHVAHVSGIWHQQSGP